MSSLFDPTPAQPLAADDELGKLLTTAYTASGRTLDDLPYTPEFEALYLSIATQNPGLSRRDVFHRLHNLRKAGKLPRLGRSGSSSIKVTQDEERTLSILISQRVGTLGQRDRLPYDARIDDLAHAFNNKTGRNLTQHDVWRLIAKIAK